MKLLVVGKSLSADRDGVNPYRLIQQNLLPKFGPAKRMNRIQNTASPNTDTEIVLATDSSPKDQTGQAQPRPDKAGATIAESSISTKNANRKAWRFWLRKLFGLEAKPARPCREIQGEFLLESVKVVRNDLSDADLELVAANQLPGQRISFRQAEAAVPRSEQVLVWPRVTARVFGGELS
jgi:hypothetical protein